MVIIRRRRMDSKLRLPQQGQGNRPKPGFGKKEGGLSHRREQARAGAPRSRWCTSITIQPRANLSIHQPPSTAKAHPSPDGDTSPLRRRTPALNTTMETSKVICSLSRCNSGHCSALNPDPFYLHTLTHCCATKIPSSPLQPTQLATCIYTLTMCIDEREPAPCV